ncbi:MAG TPA: ABC transporter substrate-binding protein [Myxococcota bacterium]|nr:ABC transporter substrate-binding protein [Myxococcota bacterium]
MGGRMRRLHRLAFILALVALAGGCRGPKDRNKNGENAAENTPATTPAANDGAPVRGDWLVFHMLADPENLNPLTSSDAGASAVLGWIFPPLVRVDNATLELRPALARALPKVSADHLTYEFELRDDVKFSDGQPFTAEDVVFTLKAIKHPHVNSPHLRNYYDSLADVVATGPHSVKMTLSQPYFMNDYVLGGTQPLPRHYYDPDNLLDGITLAELANYDALPPDKKERADKFAAAFNENFNRNPLGPGALQLENPARDYSTGEKIELRRWPGSFAAGHSELGDPWVDRFVFRIMTDYDAALVALKAGTLDAMGLRPVQYLKQTNDASFATHIEKHKDLAASFTYIGWNERRVIFQDKRVRQALSYLTDKKNICDKVMLGLADPVESPIYPKRPEYDQKLAPWPFDPAKAKALLAEAGWADTDGDGILDKDDGHGGRTPLKFEIISNSGNDDRKNLGLVVVDEFKRAGIGATFRAVDWSIMLEQVKHGDYDAVILGWTASGATPPDLYQIWHSSQAVEGGSNHIYYKNDEVDKLLVAYRTEFDAAKRKAMYDRVQEILYDEQPYTFVYGPASLSAYDKRFHGVTFYPATGTYESEWWVPTLEQKYH